MKENNNVDTTKDLIVIAKAYLIKWISLVQIR
jgi:hypothetical protein